MLALPFLAHGEILQICMYPRYWKLRGKAVWQMHGQVCGRLTEFGDICLEEVWYEVELPFSNS